MTFMCNTYRGCASLVVAVVVDRVNRALQFDGVDDHVLLPSIHSLGLTNRYQFFLLSLFYNLKPYLTGRFLVAAGLFRNRAQMTSKCCTNKKNDTSR